MLKELIDFAKGLILIFIYSFGYRNGKQKKDMEEIKSDLDWRDSVDKKREEIRTRYRNLKSITPDDWDGIEQLRKASELQSSSKANNSTNSSGSKI